MPDATFWHLVNWLFPSWVIAGLGTVVTLMILFNVLAGPAIVISRWELLMIGLGVAEITVVYWYFNFADAAGIFNLQRRIALTRLAWVWLLIVGVYISLQVAKRRHHIGD